VVTAVAKFPQADATTWVMQDTDGVKKSVKVTHMSDEHLFRWIRYFRKKWRDNGHVGSDAQLDAAIRGAIVTAPAIFAEAAKRGVYVPPSAAPVVPPPTAVPPWASGASPADPMSIWMHRGREKWPLFWNTVMATAFRVESQTEQILVTFTSDQMALRGLFEGKRAELEVLAVQTWKRLMPVRSLVVLVDPDALMPSAATESGPLGSRRITLEDEE